MKEKAKELIEKFKKYASRGEENAYWVRTKNAKQCAIICCDEIIIRLKQDTTPHEPETIDGELIGVKYWQAVKKELNGNS